MNSKKSARSPVRCGSVWVALASAMLASCAGFRPQEETLSKMSFSPHTRIGVIYANGWDEDLFPEVKNLVRRMKLANKGAEETYGVLADSLDMMVIRISEPESQQYSDGAALESPRLTAAKENLDAVVEFQVKPLLLTDSRPGQQGYRRIRILTSLTLYNRTGDVAWRSARALTSGTSMYWSKDLFPTLIEQRGTIDALAEPMAVELLEALPIIARTQ